MMLDKFWESVGQGLGGKWLEALVQPVLVFWAAGLLAWVGRQPDGWDELLDKWDKLDSTEAQITVLVALLLGLVASSQGMRWVQHWLLRVLEGYHWPRFARTWAAQTICKRLKPKLARWQHLNAQVQENGGDFACLRASELEEYARLDYSITQRYPPTQTPPQLEDVMPTAVGNRLKAAELHPRYRYGLDSIIVWPRLWPLLPEALQQAVGEARGSLDAAVRLFGWGLLTVLWVFWGTWWAPLLGLGLALVAWFRAVSAAEVYGDLIRAAFDLHRFCLYESLRWPLPEDTATEAQCGEQLTAYLMRGLTIPPVHFTAPEE